MAITHEESLTDAGATLAVTHTATPEKRTSTPAADTLVQQRALRQGWTTTDSDITKEPYARRIGLPVAEQVMNQVMTSGPHLANAHALQKMIDEQRKHNHEVYRANEESLDQGQAFI